MALECGGVDEVAAVGVQHVEEEGGERHLGAEPVDVGRARGAGPGDLEGSRAAALVEDDRLAVEHEVAPGQRGHRLDHLGKPLGDLVEAAREDGDLAAAAVHLDPDAVELAVDEHARAGESVDRLGGGLRGGGEHRAQRAPDDQADLFERLLPSPRGDARDHVGGAGEHHGPADDGVGDGVRAGDGRQHDAVEGPLPEVAGHQLAEEALLVGGGPTHEGDELGAAGGGRPGAGRGREPVERGVDVGDGEPGLRGGVGERPERAVPDAEPALREDAGQERDDGADVVGVRAGEQGGDGLGLRGARAGGRDLAGDGDEVGERDGHPVILPGPTDIVPAIAYTN